MYACIYELRKNCRGWTGGESKVLQEVLADLKRERESDARENNHDQWTNVAKNPET